MENRKTHRIDSLNQCTICNAAQFQLDEFSCAEFQQKEFIATCRKGLYVMQIFIDMIERQMKQQFNLPVELVENPAQREIAGAIAATPGVSEDTILQTAAALSLAVGQGNPAAVLAALADTSRAVLSLAAWYDLPLEHALAALLVDPVARGQAASVDAMVALLAEYRSGKLKRSATPIKAIEKRLNSLEQQNLSQKP